MKLGDFLASKAGKRIFNFAYCWGACLIIAGAIFKIMNLPYDDVMLMIGMGMEVLIFFIAGFETPASEYKWSNVFPELNDEGDEIYAPSSKRGTTANNAIGGDYAKKTEALTANMDQLNEIYKAHITSMSSSTQTINQLNADLAKVTKMYSESTQNGSMLASETEALAKQVAALNQYYSRMLNAMNVTANR